MVMVMVLMMVMVMVMKTGLRIPCCMPPRDQVEGEDADGSLIRAENSQVSQQPWYDCKRNKP